ncbi:hypothetical protein [Nocardioides sp.]|uniref:hypothetical protein n=1 Tax=Nocardioides sp. TaxID=35761 RepID=UPI003567502C
MTQPEELGRTSIPGMGPDEPLPPRADPAEGESRTRAQRAAYVDSRTALRFGAIAAVPTITLILLALTADAGVWTTSGWADSPADTIPLPRSLLALVLLLISLQLVCVLLALEHLTHGASRGRRITALVAIATTRIVVLAAVVAAIAVGRHGDWDTWSEVGWAGALLEAVTLLLIVGAWWWSYRWVGRAVEFAGPFHAVAGRHGERPRERSADGASLPRDAQGRLLAIGASGGGIRAAAFVLGGHQAVQDLATPLELDRPECEPPVFAVSGGSYIGAALALRRAYTAQGQPREEPTPWVSAYDMESPELERLRRHTRYLFEPTWAMKDGAVSLLMGAVVNLTILALVLRFLTWVSGQIALTVGLVTARRNDRGDVVGLSLAQGWRMEREWLLFLSIPLFCLALMVTLTVASWIVTSSFDHRNLTRRARTIAQLVRSGSERLRPALLGVGAGWLLLVLALPAGVVGVVSLMATNQPTAMAATWLDKTGFGSPPLCRQAMVAQVAEAAHSAQASARTSPGETRQITTGACGFETTVARTWSPGDPEPDLSAGPANVLSEEEKEAARALVGNKRLPGQIAGIGGLLLLVVGLLRHGPSPQSSVNANTLARVRRAALTWLPLGIVASLAVFLTLLWTLHYLTGLNDRLIESSAALTALACVIAFFIDANATSMHGFYRSRLSDAFAVGVDDTTRVASELPPPIVYRFSHLAQGAILSGRPAQGDQPARQPVPAREIPLHIVTTVNSQAANEAPTMRGGFPMVFGPDSVDLYREARQRVCVQTKRYEEFAGIGRVSIMATVATSGAAISPLMGRYGEQMAPYRVLLALFNLRVGTWVRNPMHVGGATLEGTGWRKLLWMSRRPGLAQVALEAFGNSSANRRWIYLSDGGHLDNTGLVESVRHCVNQGIGGRVLVLDASNDPVDTWSAVGDAVGVVRADLDIDLRREWVEAEPPWMRRYSGAGLDVVVVKAVRTEPPDADSNDRDWSAELPPNVRSFQLVTKDFPRSSTARQKFGDLEFEAYRALGYAATVSSVEAAGWD